MLSRGSTAMRGAGAVIVDITEPPADFRNIGTWELLVLMSKGYSSNDIAELRGVKVETVRSTLKGVFKKTDCHSQNELLLLLQSIS